MLLVFATITLLTRFFRLTAATATGTPVFDEKHYVPQAFDMVKDASNFITGGIELNPGYGLVVHPPLAKQIIAIGEFFFGYSPLGWRLMAAICGTTTVLLIMLLARQLSRSRTAMTIAGVLGVCDGVLLVTSRFGMLDIFQVLFIVAAALFAVQDFNQMHRRIHEAYFKYDGDWGSAYGPRFGFRWWRFAEGVMIGCSLSVKWSGLYYIAFFGVLSVALDWYLRHKYQAQRPLLGALLYDTIPALGSLFLMPVLLYVWAWRAWFSDETAVYRHAIREGVATGWVTKLPDSLGNWIYYHQSVLKFHASLTNANGHMHPWESKPWSWLVASRPILYYSSNGTCMGGESCSGMIYLFGTPAIWWMTVPAIAWALYSAVIRRRQRYILPLVAFAAGWLPWFSNFGRQMYFFYAAALIPFTIVMIAMACHDLWGRGKDWPAMAKAALEAKNAAQADPELLDAPADSPAPAVATASKVGLGTKIALFFGRLNLTPGSLAVCIYMGLVVAAFIYWSPILYGYMVPTSWYNSLMWLPSWK
ncbi:MAG: phospholipid carrier-dependent glycosyltransferase [Corynebacterium sp.]|nr:phospholipid carrier-dependent glycosyltransferase [Corynebacterium sp.]